MSIIETNRRRIGRRPVARRLASPAIGSLDRALVAAIRATARGDLLDAGCGSMPYRGVIERYAASYDGLDIEARSDRVRYLCSVTEMSPVQSASYDTVLCSEVLEHVSDPQAAVAEIARVLRPGGTLILSVPFLSRLHEEPHDYFRYTRNGLRSLLLSADLRIDSVEPIGSVGGFIGHQIASALVGTTWHIPLLKWVVLGFTAAAVTLPCIMIDRLLSPIHHKLPLGYVVVAHNPEEDDPDGAQSRRL